MRVKRSFLYWGAFLTALGAVLLIAEANGISDAFLRDALRLWPLVFVAIGIALILRRTRVSWAGGMLAAAVPGMVLGGALVAGPRVVAFCDGDLSTPMTSRQGSFAGPASVELVLRCGQVQVGTAPGAAWEVRAANDGGWSADITESPDRLVVASGRHDWFGPRRGHDEWRLTLPTQARLDVGLEIDAGAGRVDLAGADLGTLTVSANAADVRLDLSTATVERVVVDLNAGAVAVVLPDDDLTGSLAVDAGSLEVCAPAGLGLRIRSDTTLADARYPGLVASGDTWESPDYATARHHAQLTVDATVGSIELNPAGGCK